jgi:hypothetical protein
MSPKLVLPIVPVVDLPVAAKIVLRTTAPYPSINYESSVTRSGTFLEIVS